MTIISTDAVNARESARSNSGQFGTQEHSAPELALHADRASALQDTWETRQALAREVEAATVNQAVAHMPDNIRGLRFVARDGELILALVIPTKPGGHIAGSDFHEHHRPVIEAYANSRSTYIDLEPITEKNGGEAWEWIPSPEQRNIPADFADVAREDALARFREADYDFNTQAADYLRAQIPEGIDTVEVAFGPVNDGHGYSAVPTVTGAYDAEGKFVFFDVTADYRVNVARIAVADMFPVRYTETNAAVYTIAREA